MTKLIALPGTKLFDQVDFAGLSQAIDKLGQYGASIPREEKGDAIYLIDEWEKSVISRLNQKLEELRRFQGFFRHKESYNAYSHRTLSDDMLIKLAEATGTTKLYEKYLEALDAETNLKYSAPKQPTYDPDLSDIERMEVTAEWKVEYKRWDMQLRKIQSQLKRAETLWREALLKHESVKLMLSQATTFSLNVQSLTNACRDKSTLAKIAITINSKEVREAMQEMVKFAEAL